MIRTLRDIAVVWLLAIPAIYPLTRGYLVGTDDGYSQLYKMLELERAFRAGDLYPRWAPEWALGFGYPVFTFYPPLSLYLALPFSLIGLGSIAAFNLSQIVSILVGGAGAYALARSVHDRLVGVVAGVLFATAPYLMIDVYMRGAVAETLALALCPWLVLAVRRLVQAPTSGRIAAAALSVALIALAHNITSLVALPTALLYALSVAPGIAVSRRLAPLALAAALGLAASAIYWLPALVERDLVKIHLLTTAFYDFRNHFQPLTDLVQRSLRYEYRYDYFGGLLFRAGLMPVFLAAIGAALLRTRETLFWVLVCLGVLLLQLRVTEPVWAAVPLLPYLQFPWRLLTLLTLATALLASGIVAAVRHERGQMAAALGVLSVSLWASITPLSPPLLDLREDEISPAALNRIEIDRRLVGTTTAGEYLPRDAVHVFEGWDDPIALPGPPVRAGELLDARRGRLELAVEAPVDGALAVDRYYSPHWRALVDGKGATLAALPGTGLLSVAVPRGSRNVALELGSTLVEVVAAGLTAIGALAIVAVALARRSRTTRAIAAAAAGGLTLALIWAALQPDTVARVELAGATWEGGPRLLGGRFGDDGEITLHWTADSQIDRDVWVALRAVDDAGRVVGRRDKQPLVGRRPSTLWQPGYVVRDRHELQVPVGGRYRLIVGLFDARGYLRPTGTNGVTWQETCPCAAPSQDGIGVPVGSANSSVLTPLPPAGTTPPIAVAADRIALTAIEYRPEQIPFVPPSRVDLMVSRLAAILPSPSDGPAGPIARMGGPGGVLATLPRGSYLTVLPTWRALADVGDDYAVTLQLLNHRQALVAQDDEWPRRGFSPTSLWHTGEATRDRYSLRIPEDAPPGRHRLVLGLYPRRDLRRVQWSGQGAAGDWLDLGSVKIPPPIPQQGAVSGPLFGGAIRLTSVTPTVQTDASSRRLRLDVTWSVDRAPDSELTTFVHLVDATGKPVAQGDSPPLAGAYPTPLWEAGERIDDSYSVAIPAGLGGRARLLVGLYRPTTGERLALDGGGDAYQIDEIDLSGRP